MNRTLRPCGHVFAPALHLWCLLLLVSSGCAQWSTKPHWPWKKEKRPDTVAQIVPMWTDTVLYEAGMPGVRGFGSRVYFYEENGKKPIRVDGDIIIYAFDANDESRMPIPERKFIFTAEQLEQHYSKTQLGPSYSLWIPWDEVGGPPRQLSLVTRFEGKDGDIVVSDPARKLLPGIPVASGTEEIAKGSPGEKSQHAQLSYEENGNDGVKSSGSSSGQRSDATALSLELPPSFAKKLQGTPSSHPSRFDATSDRKPETSARANAKVVGWWVEEESTERETPERAVSSEPSALPDDDSSASVTALPATDRLSTHFEQRKYQARNQRGALPTPAALRKQPHRGGWLSGLPPTPRSENHATPAVESDATQSAR